MDFEWIFDAFWRPNWMILGSRILPKALKKHHQKKQQKMIEKLSEKECYRRATDGNRGMRVPP